jgi:hypothetical protein
MRNIIILRAYFSQPRGCACKYCLSYKNTSYRAQKRQSVSLRDIYLAIYSNVQVEGSKLFLFCGDCRNVQNIVAANKSIAILVLELSVYVLLSLADRQERHMRLCTHDGSKEHTPKQLHHTRSMACVAVK